MKKALFATFAAIILNFVVSDAQTLTMRNGAAVTIEWYTPDIVRVIKTPDGKTFDKPSLAVTAQPGNVKVKTTEQPGETTIASSSLKVTVDNENGIVTMRGKKGNIIAGECAPAQFSPMTDGDHQAWSVSQSFKLEGDEAIFGLGIPQNGKMSQRGENRTLVPDNTADGIPFVMSELGYGIYWDNYSSTKFTENNGEMTFTSETGDAVDYYFMYGGDADGVVACIRTLTGAVPMVPLWTYGFHQSKERYKSQEEITGVLHKYRQAGIPVDCMIQDWQYWGNNYLWNAMEFMSDAFPNPKAMLDDIHSNNAKCMISIWSSFGPMTKPYRELDEKGLLFNIETWPQSGISHIWPPRADYPSGVRVYDCYTPEARDIYWKHLSRLHNLGLDGWWMDSTEPDHFNWRKEDFDHKTGLGTYRSVRLAYPLMTVGGVYDHQRATTDTARVFILTRSGSFGQQRYGANVWSGDVVSTWDMLRKQVPAGLNFSLTGNPNFNSDLGGFFAGSYNGSWKGLPAYQNPAYRELYTRWMQQGIFTPMMRSHGADVPREIYNYGKPGEPVYDALVDAVKLRYRLLPYVYSTAHDVSAHNGTFMRALVMDFPNDSKAVRAADKYMFGRSILVASVLCAQYTPEVIRHDSDANAGWDKNTGKTTIEAMDNVDFTAKRKHSVYLPKGASWYYFHDNKKYEGGNEISLDVDLSTIPFFIKAGSILPLGPDVQYTSEKPWDQLDVLIYPGADATFTLYEDEGDGYNYEKGVFSEIPMTWNNEKKTLTIGNRTGAYPGMIQNRTFNLILPDGTKKSVAYSGKKTTVKF